MKILRKYLALFIVIFTFISKVKSDGKDFTDEAIDLSYLGSRMYGLPDAKSGDLIKNIVTNNDGNMTINPEELGSYAEGDILIPKIMGKNGILAESYRWSGGVVPFEIRGSFSEKDKNLIHEAIGAYHKETCIRFIARNGKETDFISIQNAPTGCWSSVGRVGGPQIVNLQTPGCTYKVGTIIHELMHALGFLHEQNREERDSYVTIMMGNVKKGNEVNFEKAPKGTTSGFGVGYDYESIMHYSANAFSINGQPTIIPKQKAPRMGQRDGFSFMDIKKIWKMYNCKSTISSSGYKLNFIDKLENLQNPFSELMSIIFPSGDEEEGLASI